MGLRTFGPLEEVVRIAAVVTISKPGVGAKKGQIKNNDLEEKKVVYGPR